jgi:RNA polymerase sigma-70 factor, ECF subfamily
MRYTGRVTGPVVSMPGITELLRAMRVGDRTAADQVMSVVYRELKKLAKTHLRSEQGGVPQTTELVHEAFLRLFGGTLPSFESRAHFYGIASRLMRQVLVDASRARDARKRSGLEVRLAGAEDVCWEGRGFLAVHDALERLEAENEQRARLIEMRFFGGMTAEESAVALGLPVNVVRQQLRLGQAWLRRELSS